MTVNTCVHDHMPKVAVTLPLTRELRSAGVERCGFHRPSCESIVQHRAGTLAERLITAHLGNGASITAVSGGVSIRAQICARFSCVGVVLDDARNRLGHGLINHDAEGCKVMILPLQDEQIPRHVGAVRPWPLRQVSAGTTGAPALATRF